MSNGGSRGFKQEASNRHPSSDPRQSERGAPGKVGVTSSKADIAAQRANERVRVKVDQYGELLEFGGGGFRGRGGENER